MAKVLTISVAAYNMEKYLDHCLASMAIPEIEDDLEVYVIDDGGTDRSLEIAEAYADKYPGTFIPVHKENGGWGSTVNYSIAHATGIYFKILDGDDWFDKAGLVTLVKELKKARSDVVVTSYYQAKPDGITMISVTNESKAANLHEVMETMPLLGLHVLCFRTDILRQSGMVCPEHKFYCDAYFQTVPFSVAKTIEFLAFPVCYYLIGRDGQSIDKDTKMKHQDELLWVCRDLVSYCANKKENINYFYIMRKTAEMYKYAIDILRCNPVNRESLAKIKDLDRYVQDMSGDVYKYSANHCGKFIWLMRKTNYCSYWLQGAMQRVGDSRQRRKSGGGGVAEGFIDALAIACCAGTAA